jgi:hypothetical protein
MGYYKELLADVRRKIRQIRREEKELNKSASNHYKKAKEQYELEVAKMKRITGGKYRWSLGSMRKTTENLEKVLEELNTFTSQPNILKTDRDRRFENRVKEFMHNWDLQRDAANKFFDIINSSEIEKLIEGEYLSSSNILELSTNQEHAKRVICNLTNMTEEDKKKLTDLPESEKVDFLREIIKRR